MVSIYAVADIVPKSSDHLTAGKEYKVEQLEADGFFFKDDLDCDRFSRWRGTRLHLDGGNWRRVEREE